MKLHLLQEGAMKRTSPSAPSFNILHRQQEGAPRSASTRPSQAKAHLAHQGATRKMPRWTTTCLSFKTTSTHLPSFGTSHQAQVEDPSQGHQGIQMTFGDTLPLKSVNVDMRRRWRQVHTLWCLLQVPPQHRCPSQVLYLSWSLHQVPPPQWPPYGKMKTFYATIAKAKDMIHENVPISCAQYAMAKVT